MFYYTLLFLFLEMRKDAGGYIILGGFEQRPWTPTKRRGPIALEMASPGPACVQLPQLLGTKVVDSKRGAAPAFSFGAKHKGKTDTIGPGPAEYNITGLGAKGKDTPPQISLAPRAKAPHIYSTPAPGEFTFLIKN